MPAGNGSGLLSSRTWQPFPDLPGFSIFPEIRKADVISSNAYLIRTPDCLLLIDPGGLASQAELLIAEIAPCLAAGDLPLVVLLTHAHVDHFTALQEHPLFLDTGRVILAVQEIGARAIGTHDTALTQAEVLGRDFTPLPVGIRLFAEGENTEGKSPREFVLPCGVTATLSREDVPRQSGLILKREVLALPRGTRVELYHTPGHSPDSTCIRIGKVLFIGDLLFAANPGVAGLHGWDQDALIGSLDRMLGILQSGEVDMVCPGHGRIISSAQACTMLEGVLTDARALTGIAELNRERAEETARFAEDCMEEINELFTILAGRLYYVAHVMDELGETDLAAQAGTLIDAKELDNLLASFQDFADAHHAQDYVSIHLALKAGQVIGKLERSFMKDELAKIVDISLVRRAERLLSSYSSMLRGFTPPQDRETCELCPLIESVIIGLTGPSCSDDDILASTDDAEAFCRLLVARLGTRPLFDDVRVSFERGTGDPRARIDRDLFSDLLIYLFEDLVGTGAETIAVSVLGDGTARTVLKIAGTGRMAGARDAKNVRGFFTRLCERSGGHLEAEGVPGGRSYTIAL
ncbi:MBL fold metallo-hydrolase [Methanoregula sp. UBA64]|uniref:MBL fold metallo-hydrolase n=1 Tax=Methanoregula sp. UBA64 TaxID=1915554 RepID=UPI0025DD9618|nr:MBL fold metallo-hydrolase [Methanoregula sp. UBA64]